MNDYKEKVDRLVGLLLDCEELEMNCELILDSETAYDVAKELYYELDKYFLIEEIDQFEKDLKDNDILGVALLIHSDGEVEYFLQPVMDDEGETYGDDLTDVVYIQDNLMDCVDINEFVKADKFIIKDFDDSSDEDISDECDCCSCCDKCDYEEDEDYETEIEEDVIEVLLGELLDTLSEIKQSDIKGFNISLRRKITEAYEMGLDEGYENAVEEIKDTLDNMVY